MVHDASPEKACHSCRAVSPAMTGSLRRVALLALSAALAAAAPIAAEETAAAGPTPARAQQTAHAQETAGSDGVRTMRRLPVNIARGLLGVVHADNVVPFIVGSSATATASFFDGDVRDEVTDQFAWSDSMETAGGPLYSSLFVAGMFAAGRFSHHGRFQAMTYDMLDAAIVNQTYSSIVKVVVGRERPDGSDEKSFPSGHTSNAFALAAVASHHYGWKLGVPAYAVAAVMGASRVNEDRHWLSDVFAGATLGYISGRTVARVNGRAAERTAGLTWSVSPAVSRRSRGMQVTLLF